MIRHSMTFDDFRDFYNRRIYIRAAYNIVSKDEKVIYKYYVYSRRLLREKTCDIIWGYINASDDEELKLYAELLYKENTRYS